jgi:WD40 repeat protein
MVRVHTARFMVTPECAVFARSSRPAAEKDSAHSEYGTSVEQTTSAEQSNRGGIEGTDGKDSKTINGAEGQGEGAVEWELIIGLRDTSHLTYLHCSTYDQRFISLNELTWDTHSSFTPLQLVVSPNRKYLLVATDKNFHFMVKIGCNKRIRFFAGGHSSGDYGKPKVSFDHTGKYIYCNNEDGSSVTVYSISSEKPVRTLSEHDGSVRDVACHPSCSLLITASYDKSAILWTPAVK